MITPLNKPHVLIFSFAYYPRFIGGAEVAIKEITDRIAPGDIEFDMITLCLDSRLPKYEKIGNVNIYRIGWSTSKKFSTDSLPFYLNLNKYAYLLTGLSKAISLNRKRKYDAIWSIMANYSSFAAVLFKLMHPKIPYLLTLQDGDPISYLKRRALPLYPLFKMIFTKADHIQTISNYLADWAKNMGAKCPVTVVPNAVDLELFSKPISSQEAVDLKSKLGKKENDVFLVTTSRLVEKNAVGDIIESLKYLPANIKLLILGQGHEEGKLRELAIELGLNNGESTCKNNVKVIDRVQFLGFISHKDMPPYLQISDIFVRPSLSEGLGVSFLEAMAAGLPIIATPVGGIPDFLKDGETGLFCEVGNPRSIAQKVEKLIKDKESRDYIIKNASKMIREKYQWIMIAKKMQEILVEKVFE